MPNQNRSMPQGSDAQTEGLGIPHVSVWRRSIDKLMTLAAAGAVVLVLIPLAAVFGYLVYKGFGSLNWAFLTQTPKPVGEAGGGMANAIGGTAVILLIGCLVR